MKDKNLFKIGEISKMFHLSMSTLRHYENIGVLKPEYVDERTGYRYYGIRQFEVLNTIRYLRMLDFSLVEIETFLKNRSVEVMQEQLQAQKERIQQKINDLCKIQKKLDFRISSLQDAIHSDMGIVKETCFPKLRISVVRNKIYPTHYLDLEYTIRQLDQFQEGANIHLGNVGIGISKENLRNEKFDSYDFVFLILDDEDDYVGNIQYIPASRYVCIRFQGGHQNARKYYEVLMRYVAENHYTVCGFSQEITLIDNGLTSDESLFVTEIRIPIK